jgi:hypothetical protein
LLFAQDVRTGIGNAYKKLAIVSDLNKVITMVRIVPSEAHKDTMRPLRSRVPFTKYLPWIVFILAVVYFAIAWWWKRDFVWGESVGPYWLFVAMDWTVLPLTIVSLLSFFAASAVWLVRVVRREPSAHSAALPSGVLLLASLVFLGACFPSLVSPITPLDSLRVHGRVYYLSGITALMDENYALFECDGAGLMCQEVYRSGDYAPTNPMQAELAYDDATNTLSIVVGEHGTIHVYHPKS